MKTALILSAATAGLMFTAPMAIAGMSEAEFNSTHVGKCVTYSGESNGTQCYNANGTASYDDASWGKDTGTWQFTNGQFCVKWSKEAGTTCTTYTSNGNGTFSGGGYTWTVN